MGGSCCQGYNPEQSGRLTLERTGHVRVSRIGRGTTGSDNAVELAIWSVDLRISAIQQSQNQNGVGIYTGDAECGRISVPDLEGTTCWDRTLMPHRSGIILCLGDKASIPSSTSLTKTTLYTCWHFLKQHGFNMHRTAFLASVSVWKLQASLSQSSMSLHSFHFY